MNPAIEILRLHSYAGPNIYGPHAGVLLRIRHSRDAAQDLREQIRDAAQMVGLVIAYLETEAHPYDSGFLLQARFNTNQPTIGAALCRIVVDALRLDVTDTDALVNLAEECRQATLSAAAVQLLAEARRRGMPTLIRPDGKLQLGYASRHWVCDPQAATIPLPPWERIGSIPITLVTGHDLRSSLVEHSAAPFHEAGMPIYSADGLDCSALRDLLCDPSIEALVVGLDTESIVQYGLPLDRCEQAVIGDMGGPRPPSADSDAEWLRAIGLPMLLSHNPARFNLGDARLHALIHYAPNGVVNL
ncbi:hypothetical protein OSCT_0384 [Oscillochloris trichoides DG-6]|uniref:Uncharacterized protein n=1 Tax=Oscillochloris trichoides DG-6 TaxID=765420 RepID=E1IAN3_9CHLR|nr:DUF4938 domain-containing protein [Oscillochloris trichoides]EFO81807.1 hypothetical protein OSCT_0384 [Oscillochloris trichoides DG-6]